MRYEWGEECFSNNGKYITYSSNEANPLDMLVYVHNIESNQTSCVTAGKSGWYVPGYWSPDNKRINCYHLVWRMQKAEQIQTGTSLLLFS